MSLKSKIEADIAAWEKKIASHQRRIEKMKVEIKQLRRLLGLAEGFESER